MIKCLPENCTYEIPDVDAYVAASLLIKHNNVHNNASFSKPKPLKMNLPLIGRDCNEEVWNPFLQKWDNV